MTSLGPIAAQLALQQEQEKAYSATAFQPYVEAPDGSGIGGRACRSCKSAGCGRQGNLSLNEDALGATGPRAQEQPPPPSLVGVTGKFPEQQLIALLHNPNERMRAGHMPAVDASPGEMSALLAYLGVVGTRAANVQASSGTSPQPSSTASQAVSETALPAATNATSSAPSGGQPTIHRTSGRTVLCCRRGPATLSGACLSSLPRRDG